MRLWLLLPLVLLAAACGSARPAADGGDETGVLSVESVPTKGSSFYIEGFLWNIEAHRVDGDGGFSRPATKGNPVVVTLPAGTYRLESSVSPCDGNCGYLDAGTDACSGEFEITAGERTELVVKTTAGKPCVVS